MFTAKMFDIALTMAHHVHSYQTDRQGMPYILHPIAVMQLAAAKERTKDLELMALCIVHDMMEDSSVYSWNFIRSSGFTESFCFSLHLLTHRKEDSYDEYISAIANGTMIGVDFGLNASDAKAATIRAIKVKMADLTHNSDLSRLKGVKEKDLARVAKYHTAYKRLEERLAVLLGDESEN